MPSARSSPAVSVVLPTYNRRDRLPRSITSVLRQSHEDFELIIVDDGSTDGTDEFVRGLADPRITYIKETDNRGQSTARNIGIRAARAPLVAFQDSDDEWVEDKLAVQLDAFARDPRVAMVYGDLLRIPREGEPFVLHAPELKRGRLFDGRPTLYATYGLGAQTCMIRRDVLLKLGGFEERMRCFEDLELFLRIARRYPVIRLPRPLSSYYDTDGASRMKQNELLARAFLLHRYWLYFFFGHRTWRRREIENIKAGRLLGHGYFNSPAME